MRDDLVVLKCQNQLLIVTQVISKDYELTKVDSHTRGHWFKSVNTWAKNDLVVQGSSDAQPV